MSIAYLKRAGVRPVEEDQNIEETVRAMLHEIADRGESAVSEYAAELDGWTGPIALDGETRERAVAQVPEDIKRDIRFAHDNIRRFAEAQKATLSECEVELMPGHFVGQRVIPVSAAGCYVPGGRYVHVASALMTITTAKVAGVSHIVAASPPRGAEGIPAAALYAMELSGADTILTLGGVQAVAAMAEGLFGAPPADILVGPGNAYVAEAKRRLFGRVGIDALAGPTDSLLIADETADPELVAWDLVSQAEHGPDSPVWLVTTSRMLADTVLVRAPALAEQLPERNRVAARVAWTERAEVILCDTREEMVAVADDHAPEHLHVQARDLDWWLNRLSCYGSLFLGPHTTVSFGDKVSGPNHVLPTSRAARYTGGLSVHKFTKVVTWQRSNTVAMKPLAEATARISRLEGMEGHAMAADIRLSANHTAEIRS